MNWGCWFWAGDFAEFGWWGHELGVSVLRRVGGTENVNRSHESGDLGTFDGSRPSSKLGRESGSEVPGIDHSGLVDGLGVSVFGVGG